MIDEVRFPERIAYGATGGPTWSTTVAALQSGFEQRIQNWTAGRHRYNVSTGIKRIEDYAAVLAFFHARRGRLRGFRFKDWSDFTSSSSPAVPVTANDQQIGIGPGPHRLTKLYADPHSAYLRRITRPVAGTVRISVDGVEQVMPAPPFPWAVDVTTGIVTFTAAQPGANAVIRAGFEFDVPVRFDTDRLAGSYESFRLLAARDIELIELRE
jgi:uncharacterized protein (TIGR02217 family)